MIRAETSVSDGREAERVSTKLAVDQSVVGRGTSVVSAIAQHVDEVGAELAADGKVDDEVDRRVDCHQHVAPVRQVTTVDFHAVFHLIETQLQTHNHLFLVRSLIGLAATYLENIYVFMYLLFGNGCKPFSVIIHGFYQVYRLDLVARTDVSSTHP